MPVVRCISAVFPSLLTVRTCLFTSVFPCLLLGSHRWPPDSGPLTPGPECSFPSLFLVFCVPVPHKTTCQVLYPQLKGHRFCPHPTPQARSTSKPVWNPSTSYASRCNLDLTDRYVSPVLSQFALRLCLTLPVQLLKCYQVIYPLLRVFP